MRNNLTFLGVGRRNPASVRVIRHARCGHVEGIYAFGDDRQDAHAAGVMAALRHTGGQPYEFAEMQLDDASAALLAPRCEGCHAPAVVWS
jgi:hypothetical protein